MDNFRKFNESVDQEHEIISMYKDNARWQIRQISELTGISVAGIYRILEKYGIKPHRRLVYDNHNIVQQYYQSGVPANKISELTGYSKRQVYNIIHSFSEIGAVTPTLENIDF
jgi:hypothetical protein